MATIKEPHDLDQVEKLRFYAFQHAYTCTFVEALEKDGIPGLLTLQNQLWHRDRAGYQDGLQPSLTPPSGPFFQYRYAPSAVVAKPYPRVRVDFDLADAYAQYNWEVFFHIPLLVATRLMHDERHEEAMRWFHYIFNPMTDSMQLIPKRYWFFKPLRDEGKPETIKKLLQTLQTGGADKAEIEAAIATWREHPFEPHRIARQRPGAYQKTVVMKYLDNLIAWGDKLFRRDTIESINEATQLYVLAAKLLGARPRRVPGLDGPETRTYIELRPKLDAFSNALVWIESKSVPQPFTPGSPGSAGKPGTPVPLFGSLYFCIPHNDRLLQYWDTVADRLFKIRQCMNIEGVVRELPLFEPPIDPALLVRARAMGLDLTTVLDDLSAPSPHYRFTFMLQKAREFCEELKQLASLLLSALEKKDAEQLAYLRAGHEKALLGVMSDVKRQVIKETEATLASLDEARAQALLRHEFFTSRAFMNAGEKEQLDMFMLATGLQTASQVLALSASFAHGVPDQFIGPITGMASGAVWLSRVAGGSSAGSALQAAAHAGEILGAVTQGVGSASGILAGHRRRADDWKLQASLASAEIKQLDKQLVAADIRRQIAERELANHELQIEQAEKTEELLREKFTNQDLYAWMSAQVSAVYFQAYRLAYDMAKRAERAYRTELGVNDSSFIQFGAWDGLRKGLLAGERLSLDLRRLEAAYLGQSRRTYELTKHVSFALLDPYALVKLRETGQCDVHIPEVLFDLDFPSHYLRRIKSVSITIPSVVGPYTSVSCTLTLLKHWTRQDPTNPTAELPPWSAGVQSIATSGGRNDAGLFELNFRDERRLPFEGTGAVSRWRVEFPANFRQFDYATTSDVILHINYTALEGGSAFQQAREKGLKASLNSVAEVFGQTGLAKGFSLRHEFPNEWHQLRQGKEVSLTIGRDRLPYLASVLKPQFTGATWLAKAEVLPKPMSVAQNQVQFQAHPDISKLWFAQSAIGLETPMALSVSDAQKLDDLLLIVSYTVT